MSLKQFRLPLLGVTPQEITALNKLLPQPRDSEERLFAGILNEMGQRMAVLIHRIEHRCAILAKASGDRLGAAMSDQRSELCHAGMVRASFPFILAPEGTFRRDVLAIAVRRDWKWYPLTADDPALCADHAVAQGLIYIGERPRPHSYVPGASRHRAADRSQSYR
jgi:hypothetical protein